MAAVQNLYDVCRALLPFSGAPPPPHAVTKISVILDKIKCSDVGLQKEVTRHPEHGFSFFGYSGRKGRHMARSLPISYLHIHECKAFSIGIFCFPTAASIPLHDHPGMTVFSKLLYGSMHVKAYDFVEETRTVSKRRLAKQAVDSLLSAPCETTVLYPTTGNIHCFTASSPCAVLDVLTPPYSWEAGRCCTYYKAFPCLNTSDLQIADKDHSDKDHSDYVFLEEFQPADDFRIETGVYEGPRVKAVEASS